MLVRVWIAALVGAFVLIAPGAASAAPGPYPPPTSEGSGSVTPSRACAGDCVTFSGTGFKPGTTVVIRDDNRVVGTTTADANGNFSTQVCFGTDARPGNHTLTGTGTGAAGDELVVSAVVYVCGISQSPGDGDGGADGGPGGGGDGGADGGPGDGGANGAPGDGGANGAPGDGGGDGAADGAPGGGGAGGAIPFTGFMGALLALSGILLVALGSALLLALERRHRNRRRAHGPTSSRVLPPSPA